jgi:hypothetical protein
MPNRLNYFGTRDASAMLGMTFQLGFDDFLNSFFIKKPPVKDERLSEL